MLNNQSKFFNKKTYAIVGILVVMLLVIVGTVLVVLALVGTNANDSRQLRISELNSELVGSNLVSIQLDEKLELNTFVEATSPLQAEDISETWQQLQLSDWFADLIEALSYEGKTVKIFILENVQESALIEAATEHDRELLQFGDTGIYFSGGDIWFSEEAVQNLDNSEVLIHAAMTSRIASLLDCDTQIVTKFLERFSAECDDQKFEAPYPQLIANYNESWPVCAELSNAINNRSNNTSNQRNTGSTSAKSWKQLIACELAIFKLTGSVQIPPDSEKIFVTELENLNLTTISVGYKNFTNIALLENSELGQPNTNISQFPAWQFLPFSLDSFNQIDLVTYDRKNLKEIEQFRSQLENSNWELLDEASADNQSQVIYTKYYQLHNYELSLRWLDTASIDGDCINIESNTEFCGDDSIKANSGIYLQLILGEADQLALR